MLDADKTECITLANLKKRLAVFYPTMTAKEYRFLMNGKRELTMEDLSELLIDNDLTNFDPIAEAFKLYDPIGSGSINGDQMRTVFKAYGFNELSDEELDILTKAAHFDGDGQISLSDFRNLLDDPTASSALATKKVGSSKV
jgi:Ca2+-binding EF-hand superfamily protein